MTHRRFGPSAAPCRSALRGVKAEGARHNGRGFELTKDPGSPLSRGRHATCPAPHVPRLPPDCHRHRGLPASARAQGAAALHHLRLGRRRQEHADRAHALRVEADLRRPAGRLAGRLAQVGHAGRGAGSRAAGRWTRRRARAGHHHRRRLPLLLHRAAQVHRRRHAGARAVHPQHGHRRLHGRPGGDPDRRPQGRAHPDPPAQHHRRAARHPPRR